MMGGWFDVYVLSPERTKESVLRFLDHFLPLRLEAADDYAVPNHSDRPFVSFDNAADLLSYLEHHPEEPHAIYWTSDAPGDPRCAMVFPTVEGQMVYGLSVELHQRRFLSDLMSFLNSSQGYIDFEACPAADTAAFGVAVRRFNETPNE